MMRAAATACALVAWLAVAWAPSAAAQAAEGPDSGSLQIVGQVVSYLGLSLAFGGAALLLADGTAGPRSRTIRTALRSGVVVYAVGAAATWATTGDPVPLVVSVAALVAAGLAATTDGVHLDMAAATFLVAAVVHRGLAGHVAVYGVTGLSFHASHMIAVTAWIGSLVILLVVLATAPRVGMGRDAMRAFGLRYASLALILVVLTAMTGVFVAILLLGRAQVIDVPRMLSDEYGRVLYLKVLLALGMVTIAAVNRYVFLAPPDAEASPAVRRWQRLWRRLSAGRVAPLVGDAERRAMAGFVAAEIVMGSCVLILSAVLTALPAPVP